MQPLLTVLAAALGVAESTGRQVATLGYQRRKNRGPNRNRGEACGHPPPHGALAPLSATLAPKQWPVLAILRRP
jgi:hypothetical protein